jgi:hypothetical protein
MPIGIEEGSTVYVQKNVEESLDNPFGGQESSVWASPFCRLGQHLPRYGENMTETCRKDLITLKAYQEETKGVQALLDVDLGKDYLTEDCQWEFAELVLARFPAIQAFDKWSFNNEQGSSALP